MFLYFQNIFSLFCNRGEAPHGIIEVVERKMSSGRDSTSRERAEKIDGKPEHLARSLGPSAPEPREPSPRLSRAAFAISASTQVADGGHVPRTTPKGLSGAPGAFEREPSTRGHALAHQRLRLCKKQTFLTAALFGLEFACPRFAPGNSLEPDSLCSA